MQPRRLAVLAILARAGVRGVPRDTVLRLLWPDDDEEKGRRVLSQAIYMLRRDLGSEEVIEGGRVLTLNVLEISSDVQLFERAVAERRFAEAVQYYEGPFLDGFTLPSAPEFMRWADDSRDALALMWNDAVERAAAAATTRGDATEATSLWRRRAAVDPLDGRLALRLMESLEAAGDRTGAIRHAAVYAALVEQESGVEGDAQVMAFAESLKARTPKSSTAVIASASPSAQTASSLSTLTGLSSSAPTETAPSLTRTEQHRVQTAWRKGAVASVVAIAAALVVVATLYLWKTDNTPKFDERRVLVAPLANRTGDATLDPYGLMVAEWITQGLSNSGLVQVVDARSMVEIMRDIPATGLSDNDTAADGTRAIATRLGAGLVVTGTIYKSGDSLFVQIRVVNPHTGALRATVPPMRVDAAHATAALEPLRERVTGTLAVLLDTRLAHTGATGSEPPTFRAYAEYLQGIQFFGRDNSKALEHFVLASRLDANFRQARLWSGMALANSRRYPEAESTFNRVDREQLAPYDQANFDYFRAGFLNGDWQSSYKGAKRMLELAPQAAHAHYAVGITSIFTLRVQDGINMMGTVDLGHGFGQDWAPRIIALRLRGYETLGEYREALLLGKQLRELNPTAGWQRVPELRTLARTHAGTNASSVFSRRLQEAMALPPSTVGWEQFDPGDMLRQVSLAASFVGDSVLADSLLGLSRLWYDARTPAERAQTFVRRGHARVLYASGNLEDALTLYRQLDESPAAIPEDRAMRGVIALRRGDTAFALTTARALEADTASYRFGQPRAWAARIAALLNQPEWVTQLLYRARREGYTRQWEAQVDPAFMHLRKLESFREVMAPFITDGIQGQTSRPRS